MVSQVKSRSLFPPRIILKRRPSAHIAASTTNCAGDPFRSVGQGSFPVFSARGRAGAAADAKPTVDRRPKVIFLPPFHSNKTRIHRDIYFFVKFLAGFMNLRRIGVPPNVLPLSSPLLRYRPPPLAAAAATDRSQCIRETSFPSSLPPFAHALSAHSREGGR